jgi:hypothetical protein
MYPYSIEELAWATARAIKEEAQQARAEPAEVADLRREAPSRKRS